MVFTWWSPGTALWPVCHHSRAYVINAHSLTLTRNSGSTPTIYWRNIIAPRTHCSILGFILRHHTIIHLHTISVTQQINSKNKSLRATGCWTWTLGPHYLSQRDNLHFVLPRRKWDVLCARLHMLVLTFHCPTVVRTSNMLVSAWAEGIVAKMDMSYPPIQCTMAPSLTTSGRLRLVWGSAWQ